VKMEKSQLRRKGVNKKTYLAILWTLNMVLIPRAEAQTKAPMRLVQTIPLPNVEGYFDHMAVDVKGQRLFVTGEHKRTIEVVDLPAGKVIHTITGFGGDPRKTLSSRDQRNLGGRRRCHGQSF
jgi:hypothetical protein